VEGKVSVEIDADFIYDTNATVAKAGLGWSCP
jgi:hypothetical protein